MKTGIFPLTPKDKTALTDHLLSLDSADRYCRFFCHVSNSRIENLVKDMSVEGLYGYWIAGVLAAVAFLKPSGDKEVEFAVSVGAAWRGAGLSRQLFHHCLGAREADKAHRLVYSHLHHNTPMSAFSKYAPAERVSKGGEMHVTVNLRAYRADVQEAVQALCAEDAT